MTKPLDVLRIHPDDNVCVATRALAAGTKIVCGGVSFKLAHDVALGAKLALAALPSGTKVLKFGYVHTQNLESDYLHTHARGAFVEKTGAASRK